MKLGLLVKFEDIFPNKTHQPLEILLKDIPSSIVLQTLAWINAEIHYKPSEQKIQSRILNAFIGRSDLSLQRKILGNLKELYISYGSVFIFHTTTCLYLTEYELTNYRDIEDNQDDLLPYQEINILKAIVQINSEIDNLHTQQISKSIKQDKSIPNEYFYRAAWPIMFIQHEITSKRNELIQCYIGLTFIDYLKNHDLFKKHLHQFLKNNEKSDESHITQVFRTYILSYTKSEFTNPTSKLAKSVIDANPIFNSFYICIESILNNTFKYNVKDNFKSLREYPLIKLKDNSFLVTNWKYLIDKVYKSFMFSFYNSLPSSTITFNDYRNTIATNFSENIIFKNLMQNTFSKLEGISISNQSKFLNFDYYFRYQNKIILIEFKDIIIPYKKDYIDIRKNIDSKLIQSKNKKKIKHKGIIQLINNIEKISNDYRKIDDFTVDDITKNEIIIYPIIVYTDPALTIPGINDYLSYNFKSIIKNRNYGFNTITDLVMINLDFFFNNFDTFTKGTFNLFDFLEYYIQTLTYLKTSAKNYSDPSNIMNQFQSFEEVVYGSDIDKSTFFGSTLYNELISNIFPQKK